jgi:hypothetical protein
MTPEKARALRDGHPRARPMPFLPQPESYKRRELRIANTDANTLERATNILSGLKGVTVEASARTETLIVAYDLRDLTMVKLEAILAAQHCDLKSSLISRIERAIIHFTEETQLRNMGVPERLIKKSQQVYSTAWDKHKHGDHDDTPPDLRQEH